MFQWEPERLTPETKFVMGAKANKLVQLLLTRCHLNLEVMYFEVASCNTRCLAHQKQKYLSWDYGKIGHSFKRRNTKESKLKF